MNLTKKELKLYFELMWSLQYFVNKRFGILKGIRSIDDYADLSVKEKIKVRKVLFDHPEIFDEYIKENPERLGEDKLEIIRSWKKFQKGDFFIERILKRYAVFINGDKVYGVVGLKDDIGDIVSQVPYYCRAILLPFKGKIIYDGLFEGYRMYFGAGIKQNLKETYLEAKQFGKIIVSFDAETQQKSERDKKKITKNWEPVLDEMMQEAKKLRSHIGDPAINSKAFSAIRANIEFARIAVKDPQNIDELLKAFRRVKTATKNVETVIRRMVYF